MKHYPMTKEQSEILDQDLAMIMQSLGDITTLLNACYGSKDPLVGVQKKRKRRCNSSFGHWSAKAYRSRSRMRLARRGYERSWK
jgi:hypothetical protein